MQDVLALSVRVATAAKIEGIREVASLVQNSARRVTPPPPVHVPLDTPVLIDRWSGFFAHASAPKQNWNISTFHINDAVVLASSMILLTNDNRIVAETVQKFTMLAALKPFIVEKEVDLGGLAGGAVSVTARIPSPQAVSGYFALLSSAIYNNFYHWTVEILPRFSLFGISVGRGVTLLAPPLKERFQVESLAAIGVAAQEILPVDKPLKAQSLLFCSPTARSNILISPFVRDFYREFRGRIVYRKSCPRIYVSRAQAKSRRILNEGALLAALEPLGFQCVFLERLSFVEQASLFLDAQIIVAAHGAGLANLVHCRPGAAVIELLHDQFMQGMTSYWALANMFELQYQIVIGAAAADDRKRKADQNFVIDPALVLAAIGCATGK